MVGVPPVPPPSVRWALPYRLKGWAQTTVKMVEQELPPLGSLVESLLSHAAVLKNRFENEPGNNWLLSLAWVRKYADEILVSLPERSKRANARAPVSGSDREPFSRPSDPEQ